jgi:hypothetical protein
MAKKKSTRKPNKQRPFKQHRAPRKESERTAPFDFTRIFAQAGSKLRGALAYAKSRKSRQA